MKYLVLLLLPLFSQAQDFKVRAREHFEIHSIDINGTKVKYKGLSNTLNFWWEKPYELSYGFSLSPVLASLKAQDQELLGEKITYWNIGFEMKYHFFKSDRSFFLRPGIGYSLLKPSNNIKDVSGYFLYTGLGYEIPFENFGLSLEAAVRHSKLSNDITIDSFTPSVGFHFYKSF